jgi:hypothetical protein
MTDSLPMPSSTDVQEASENIIFGASVSERPFHSMKTEEDRYKYAD